MFAFNPALYGNRRYLFLNIREADSNICQPRFYFTFIRFRRHWSLPSFLADRAEKVLIENVNHHIEKEEGEMFPKVEGRFSEGQLEDLGQNLEAAKKEFGKNTRTKAASSR